MAKEKPRPEPLAVKIKGLQGIDCRKAIYAIEWCFEWASYGLGCWAFLEVLEYVGKLGILIAIVAYFYPGCSERKQATESIKQAAADARKSRHYVAWQTINSATGKPGNAGRADALQDLWEDGIPMDGISLSGHVVLLGPLDLANARMAKADFSDAEFENINFSNAEFMLSKWDRAHAVNCDFHGASFWAVDFKNSTFVLCDFGFAHDGNTQKAADFLVNFQSEHCEFNLCNLSGAECPLGIWNNVSFTWCNFAYANISQVFIGTNASIFCCNLFGATTASPAFIEWAYHQKVAFTNVVTLERWHYCVTNRMVDYGVGGPEFMEWASNQFTTYIKPKDLKAWLDWSRDNLKK